MIKVVTFLVTKFILVNTPMVLPWGYSRPIKSFGGF